MIDAWERGRWEGNRRVQHEEFMALSFREKLREIERMGEVAALFEVRRRELGLPVATEPRHPRSRSLLSRPVDVLPDG
jgi:hypothetical protein